MRSLISIFFSFISFQVKIQACFVISNITLTGNSKIIDQLFGYNIFDELWEFTYSEDNIILEQVLLTIKCMLKNGSVNTKTMISNKFLKFESLIKLQELCTHPNVYIRANAIDILEIKI